MTADKEARRLVASSLIDRLQRASFFSGLTYADRLCRLAHAAARAQKLMARRLTVHNINRAAHLGHMAQEELSRVITGEP